MLLRQGLVFHAHHKQSLRANLAQSLLNYIARVGQSLTLRRKRTRLIRPARPALVLAKVLLLRQKTGKVP